MMQNSLGRLLDGIAHTLHEVVAPGLDDDFARSQVRAAVELLGNLATRVSWRPDYLLASIERVRRVLEVAASVAPGAALPDTRAVLARGVPAAHVVDALEEGRRDHLAALAEVQAWVGSRPVEEVAELDRALTGFLRWQLEDELARLRTASFGR